MYNALETRSFRSGLIIFATLLPDANSFNSTSFPKFPISVTEFFRDIAVHAPSEKEQVRIAEFLGTLDKKLQLVSQQIEHTQTFKKGLLQQMFV